jgi:predicted nucleotidyltransferase
MSGNYVQRGGIAIADKSIRAKCATLSGVNLVLELPFPFSMASAEFFAKSAVSILNKLGCVDILSFGSEAGDILPLLKIATAMCSEDYRKALQKISSDDVFLKLGYPKLCELALKDVIKENITFEFTPNNILAIEYIKALLIFESKIVPHTVKRLNSTFSDKKIIPGNIQSAMAIRHSLSEKDISALEYVPDTSKSILLDAIKTGDFPCDEEKLSSAVISSFRLNCSPVSEQIHDAAGGLYNRLKDISFESNTIDDMVRSAESKKFTRARIRRAIFNSFLSVTSSQVKELPQFTQILALDSTGRSILKSIRKNSDFPILTKPSDTECLSEDAKRQKAVSDRADSVFQLTKPIAKDGNSALRFTPFVKK